MPRTFRIFVQMCDVLPLVAPHALRADRLTDLRGEFSNLLHAAVFFLHEGDNVGVDLREHKGAVVFEGELAFLYCF